MERHAGERRVLEAVGRALGRFRLTKAGVLG